MLIFNDGGTDREEPFQIGAPPFIGIPVAMTSNDVGEALYTAATAGTVNATFNVSTTTEEVTQHNLIADSKWGDDERTTVIGGHLDSVEEGPGINDNGSGTGAILEIAEEIAQLKDKPRNRIRFAFWGAEEAGLIGSNEYVADLIESGEIDDIEANLNFDMLASPNFVRFVYDGDNSTGEGDEGPPGSAEIEQVFLNYFKRQRLPVEPTAFDGRSDYGPFIAPAAFVPAGGLFSGAEGVKTEEEAAVYGGAAGSWYDPCYHQACDTFSTVVYQPPLDAAGLEEGQQAADAAAMRGNGPKGLGQLADAAAHAKLDAGALEEPAGRSGGRPRGTFGEGAQEVQGRREARGQAPRVQRRPRHPLERKRAPDGEGRPPGRPSSCLRRPCAGERGAHDHMDGRAGRTARPARVRRVGRERRAVGEGAGRRERRRCHATWRERPAFGRTGLGRPRREARGAGRAR